MAQCWAQTVHQIAWREAMQCFLHLCWLQEEMTVGVQGSLWMRVPNLRKGSKERQAFLISRLWVTPLPERQLRVKAASPLAWDSGVLRGVLTLWARAEAHGIKEPFPLERQKSWLQGTQYFSNFSSLNTFRSTEFGQTATWVNPFISKMGRQKTQRRRGLP